MKAVMVMFDSLNRHMLSPYNPDTFVHTPNFARLAARCATFDTSYVCSMPCMPARRDLHTARPNFLHTPWGPIEPYDDSVPEMLKRAGVYTHLASDHYHYWEDGGSTYHGRYSSWECFRGQEGDPFIGQVTPPDPPTNINAKGRPSDWINRQHITRDEQYPQSQTFDAGLKFIDRNHAEDQWFLQIECFDPHEPFVCDRRYHDLYAQENAAYDGPLLDWPGYRPVKESPDEVQHAKRNYAALMSKCDASLGDVLDAFDRHDMWDDTMLIVCTDHGFMLGEHDCWAKNWMPLYEEVARTPFFVWDPRTPDAAGQRREALVQPALDVGPTLLRLFDQEPTERMLGHDLAPVIASDTPVRDAALFGYFGNRVNVTDGRYVYMRAPVEDGECYRYTLMPVNMRGFVGDQLQHATLGEPFAFTKGMSLLRIPARSGSAADEASGAGTLLFDLQADPHQQSPISDQAVQQRLFGQMVSLMQQVDAPAEQYARMGLAGDV